MTEESKKGKDKGKKSGGKKGKDKDKAEMQEQQLQMQEEVSVESKDTVRSSYTIESVSMIRSEGSIEEELGISLVEVEAKPGEVVIGPKRLTRFEKARIVGARALQLALGVSPLIVVPKNMNDPISIAEYELSNKALPISIRRLLPDGRYQDIPIVWLLIN